MHATPLLVIVPYMSFCAPSLLITQVNITLFQHNNGAPFKERTELTNECYVWIRVLQITEKLYQKLEQRTKKLRFTPPFPLLAFPVYLVCIYLQFLI
jgi:hypothetical protein